MSNSDVLIQVKDLYKVFGDKPESVMPMVKAGKSKDEILAETGHTVGLKEIDLEIKRGEIFVIMGLSGSGKSTLIRHFNRLIEPTAGEIIVEGTDVMKLNTKELEQFRRHKMSMVFQRFGLMPHYTVLDNVAYGLKIQGVDKSVREQKAVEWLETVGLKGYEEQYPNQLSGGQQQRVGLARALCTDAEILLMDEAFSALDPLIRSEMQDQLIELQHKLNKTIIFITHDLDEALRLGDRIAILKDGLLVQQGEPEEILLNPADEYVEAFVKDVNRARALTVETVMKEPEHRITAETIGEALKEMKRGAYDYGHVVDDSGSYQGTVTQEWLEEEAKGGNADSTWEEADLTETTTITSDAVLETVIPETLEADHPIPVVDEEGQLQGELSRSSLAEVLVDSSETESESVENQKV
ncbi:MULTISPECIES: glycine betaine/L-proline ABC transporter ATP-binding protein [unclassified Marinobacterium]|jgi:glycine betaine/proline transport system ATP-binding protein|uniref:quaternary amine ABC transporter ATP-binding protein n=1 Tax=unclassified Marinobacterium TaxID=2644139 RepID=UPI0015698748|nr:MULTISPECIES: glycine betaine/L-proline ABC transporter ATP-binding protein [unclassified Marinobacterium]NRP35779.1 Glycine betaine transport ATP-binding protein OpuAA [Marinobacterium sp. xm-d-579]NRP47529.1 Glycine betaine transport ATP-binding protein OpuAA [Marinobacterium sp. xm-d-543]NRP60269.1 Glycine betaine transport ATP-binding protein OpuAA [Marinobacterium sp. xm-d-564]NRQ23886.1 Glycine betaine transport ATP-binding protein OpuAA [Marinobacterium sp. xm-m-312]